MTTTTSSTSSQTTIQSLIDKTSTSSTSTSKTEDSQTRFLKLLTTQLQNQDPLNPVDNAQTTSQLAQISTVDGVERLNTTMQTLLGSYQTSQALQAAAMVGQSVLVDGNQLQLNSSGYGVGGFTLDAAADKVVVSIMDSTGTEVASETMSNQKAGLHNFVWDGATSDGGTAAAGKYTMKVTATKGTASVTSTAHELATVTSVINGSSGITIQAGRFDSLSMSDIRSII